jgi:hypothetical protein
MNKHILSTLLVFFFLLSSGAWSQGTKPPVPNPTIYKVKHGYYYSFKGPTTQASLDSLYNEFKSASPYIQTVKLFLKPENKLSEVKIIVEEQSTKREYDEQFDITCIKRIILQHHFEPRNITVENLPVH